MLGLVGFLVGWFAKPLPHQPGTVLVRFTLDWAYQGPQAPFLVAYYKGFFAEEGLSVTVDRGYGSAKVISDVAAGLFDIGFLRAVIRGIKYTIQNPDEAVNVLLIRDPTLNKTIEEKRLMMALEIINVRGITDKYGFGYVEPSVIEENIKAIVTAFGLQRRPSLSEIADFGYLPPREERLPQRRQGGMEFIVRLRKVTVKYRNNSRGVLTTIVDIDLSIMAGKFVAIVGKSGCGKTTLLKVVAGLIRPDEGEVVMDDRAFNKVRRRIGKPCQLPLPLLWCTVLKTFRGR